jgi:CheY-like chemotaxis protein
MTLGRDCTVVEAKDGPAALEAIRQSQPEVVMLDVMMPAN